MSAPKGNQFWKARSSHGRNPVFASPDELWGACQEYFQWVEDNPLSEDKLFCFQGQVTRDIVHKMRAMTIEGMCIFLDIGTSTWSDYKHKEDFSSIVTRVEQVIRTQKFQGASADLLNANIIARDLGLRDKQDIEQSGPNGGPIQYSNVTDEELDQRIRNLTAKVESDDG